MESQKEKRGRKEEKHIQRNNGWELPKYGEIWTSKFIKPIGHQKLQMKNISRHITIKSAKNKDKENFYAAGEKAPHIRGNLHEALGGLLSRNLAG